MIDAYVVNLDRQIEKYSQVENAMDELGGFNVKRVSAIDGKRGEHKWNNDFETTWLCKNTCPDSVIAIALSHKKVARMILDSGVDYALVLEDDATPIKDGFHEKLQKTLTEIPDKWDIILLHCNGICVDSNKVVFGTGSTAAYLINKSGAQKLLNLKINNHIDAQMYYLSNIFNAYKSKGNLFITDDSDSTQSNKTTISSSIKSQIFKKVPNSTELVANSLNYNYVKMFGFTWSLDDFLNFVIYLIGFLLILFLKL